MGVGSGLYMYDVVVKRSRSLSHLLMSACLSFSEVNDLNKFDWGCSQLGRQIPVG